MKQLDTEFILNMQKFIGNGYHSNVWKKSYFFVVEESISQQADKKYNLITN